MHNVAPSSFLADGVSRCFTRLGAMFVPAVGQGDFVDFHLAVALPDLEIWDIGMGLPLGIEEREAFRLAGIRLDRWITVETESQFPLVKGFALDRALRFARDRVADVPSYGANA